MNSLHLSAVFFLTLASLPAATRIWDGGDVVNTNWNDATNWNPNTAPFAGDILIFPAGVAAADRETNNNFLANTVFAGLILEVGGYSVKGNAFDLSTAGISLTDEEFGTTTISPIIRLTNAGQSFDSGPKGLLITGAVNLNGNSLTIAGSGRVEINGNLVNSVGSASLIKTGDGSAVLAGFNSFGGNVEVNQGILYASGFVAGTGTVTVSNAATLAGADGGVTKATTITGTLSPGIPSDNTKRMEFNSLNFTSSTGTKQLRLDILGDVAGDTHDQIQVKTSLSLNSANLALHFGTYVPPVGTVFTLIDNRSAGAINGTFAGIAENSQSTVGKLVLQYSYTGGTGNDFTATLISIVNNPPTLSIATNFHSEENTPPATAPFTVDDPETPAASLTVTASSNNTTLIPNENIVLGGSGASRTITITPATDQIGSTTIILTVSDGNLSVSKTLSFTVFPPYQPVITVGGPGARFTNLTNPGGVFDRVNQTFGGGDTRIEIAGDLISETGQIPLFDQSNIRIYPVGAPRTISGTSGVGLLQIIFSDLITLDGSLGGIGTDRSLSIVSTSAQALVYLTDNSSDITIQNLILHGTNNTAVHYGVRTRGDELVRIRVQNNAISGVGTGISCDAVSRNSKGRNYLIAQNQMTALSPDNVRHVGIEMLFQERPIVINNHIAGLGSGNDGAAESNAGILVGLTRNLIDRESSNAIVSGNVIEGIRQTEDSNIIGIGVDSGNSGTAAIVNNSITLLNDKPIENDIRAGIAVFGDPGSTTKVYFNSVFMSGTSDDSASGLPTVALLLGPGNPTVDLRNNALANSVVTTDPIIGIIPSYAIGLISETAANLSSNHNVFFVPSGSSFGTAISSYTSFPGSTAHHSLADWQSFSGGDIISFDTDPQFTSSTDLRPRFSSILLNNGAPIADIATDIDVVVRDPLTPTIGAYELALPPNALETWRLTFFGIGTDTGDAANDRDSDHDGLVNLVEFALGLDPQVSDSELFPLPQKVGTNFSISLTQPAGVAGISYAAEFSPTMAEGSWQPIPNTGAAPQIEFVFPPDTEGFMRLIISEL